MNSSKISTNDLLKRSLDFKKEIKCILADRLFLLNSQFDLNISDGKIHITGLKEAIDSNTFEAIRKFLGVNSYKIYLGAIHSRIEFYNDEEVE